MSEEREIGSTGMDDDDLIDAGGRRASRGKIIGAAVLTAFVVIAIGVPVVLSRRNRSEPDGPPPVDRAAAVATLRSIGGPMGTILAALPKDTTGVAALRVARIAALDALPLDQPGFERLTGMLEKAKACGVDATKDLELVVFAQRVHRLDSKQTGDPGDARNLVFLHGAILPATLEGCAGQLGDEVTTRWLTKDIVVLVRDHDDEAYLDELQLGGQQLFDNELFVRHASHLSAEALAWGWMDTQAMQRSVPKEPLPKTFFCTIAADGDGTLRLSLSPIFRDVALARAVEQQWRRYSNGLPAGALGRGFRYSRSGTTVIARLEVPLARVTEMAAMAASLIQGQ